VFVYPRPRLIVQGTPPENAPLLASAFSASEAGRATSRKPSHITQEVAKLDSADRNAELKTGVETELKLREELVASILRADVALMSLIENSKNRLLREMAGEQKSKDTLSRFKSQRGGNSGSGIDERL
jgi:hypothetical protein